MAVAEPVNLVEGVTPTDYHCQCGFCQRAIGELRPPGGGYYSRLERREYYDKTESGGDNKDAHIAKTPLHVARWLIQRYSDPGDWVVDPTIGAGTTAVEAITQGRNVAGMEIQFSEALTANVAAAYNRRLVEPVPRKTWTEEIEVEKEIESENGEVKTVTVKKKVTRYGPAKEFYAGVLSKLNGAVVPINKIRIGDARRIGAFLDELGCEASLIVNNPPYSGDEHAGAGGVSMSGGKTWTTAYRDGLPNLAFLNEGPEYWEAMGSIYADCIRHLKPGGHFGYGIKDMVRRRQPFMLHQKFDELLVKLGLTHVGTAFLKHHPTTLHLNTYGKRYGVTPPLYQTIGVFRKGD